MKQSSQINSQENYCGLYSLFIKRLREIETQSRSDLIPFPDVFEKLCRNFSIKKEECWKILLFLKRKGIIEIVFGHGVRIREFPRIRLSESISIENNKV
jgi:hypothetical protein